NTNRNTDGNQYNNIVDFHRGTDFNRGGNAQGSNRGINRTAAKRRGYYNHGTAAAQFDQYDNQHDSIRIFDGPGDDVYIIDEHGRDSYKINEDGHSGTPAATTRTRITPVSRHHRGRDGTTAQPAQGANAVTPAQPNTDMIKNNLGTTPAQSNIDINKSNLGTTPAQSNIDINKNNLGTTPARLNINMEKNYLNTVPAGLPATGTNNTAPAVNAGQNNTTPAGGNNTGNATPAASPAPTVVPSPAPAPTTIQSR
ncbi:MAG: hypothetical protein FWE00_11150, partial [Defluviitaleaceae bacterium]|nr:hypothetical protein [Defluviitaleaceae bacterium]